MRVRAVGTLVEGVVDEGRWVIGFILVEIYRLVWCVVRCYSRENLYNLVSFFY